MSNSGSGLPLAPSTQYRDNFYLLAPPWLRTGNAEKYLYTLQLMGDLVQEKMNQAIRIRLPGLGDPTQIPYLANDRVLVQGPGEKNPDFVLRLRRAFAAWKKAGSRIAILGQLQAYLSNLQPGVSGVLPEITLIEQTAAVIFGAPAITWATQYIGDAAGAIPTQTRTFANFDWDGRYFPWRAWLVLFMASVATTLAGTNAQTSTAAAGSLRNNSNGIGSYGENTNGVWVPNTTGTAVNAPWITITGLDGLTSSNVGQWLTLGGSSNPGNNGFFPITAVNSSSSCVIANPNGVASDSGPMTWSISQYPFIGPGPVWGAPGYVFGQGQLTTPPVDTGSNMGGVWQPTISGATFGTSVSWGLNISANYIISIRAILAAWKSAGTFYQNIIVAFDGGTGVAGSSYSPNSAAGSGNPDGDFGGQGAYGESSSGVWVPTGNTGSSFNAFCQGTGTWFQCSVQNVT